MSENKCFCHLNGYEVKDAKARQSIETLNNTTSDISEDVTVLTNRMNTFTALPEGSTTADSELLDIRVGADGTVYASAGESVRTQVSNLISDDECYSMVAEEMQQETSDGYSGLMELNYVRGGINYNSGADNDIQGCIRTEFFTVTEPTTVYIKYSDYITGGMYLYVYNSDDTLYSKGSFSGYNTYTFLPDYKYKLNFYQSDYANGLPFSVNAYSKLVRLYTKYSSISDIETEINNNDYFYKKLIEDSNNGYSNNVLFNWVRGGFNNNTGTLTDVVGAIRTDDYLTFEENTTLYFSKDDLISRVWIGRYGLEDESYAFISAGNLSSYTFTTEFKYLICLLSENFTVPLSTTVEHFSMMFRTYKDYSPKGKLLEDFNINDCFRSFMKFGVIGDSLSVGWTNQNRQRNVAYSWVQYLARYCNNSGLNFGQSGITTETWFTHANCYPHLIKAENKCQAYIIGIGTNDGISIGTTSDIDLTDMNNNANTFYGNYAKIIQTIFSVNPSAKIFVFTIPYPRVEDNKNTAIREIAAMFDDVFLVDLAGEYNHYFTSDYITKFATQSHFSAPGYSNIAKLNLMLLSKTMLDNADKFTDIDTIPFGDGGIIY